MAIVNIPIGQVVYVIKNSKILKGEITAILPNNEAMVKIPEYEYINLPVKKVYGKDFFFTREKADKALVENFEKNRGIYKELLKNANSKPELVSNEHFLEITRSICNACGLPIGTFGHCGCSH